MPCESSLLISKTRRMEVKTDLNLLTISYIVLWRKRVTWFGWLTWFEIYTARNDCFARLANRAESFSHLN